MLHIVRPRRAKAVVREVLAGHMPRVWVSDRYGAQQGHGADWQVCLAHFLRDIQYALDAGDDPFARRLKRLILRALAIGLRRRTSRTARCVSTGPIWTSAWTRS